MGGFSDVYSVTLLCLNLNSDDCETYYNSVVSCVPIMEFSVFFLTKRTECTNGTYVPRPGIHGPLVHF